MYPKFVDKHSTIGKKQKKTIRMSQNGQVDFEEKKNIKTYLNIRL